MFISREKYNKLKFELNETEQRLKEFQKYDAELTFNNTNLSQENASLRNDNQDLHDTIRQVVQKMNKFDYKTMNIYTFFRNIKNELSNSLEDIR